jgi:hypothetical protein
MYVKQRNYFRRKRWKLLVERDEDMAALAALLAGELITGGLIFLFVMKFLSFSISSFGIVIGLLIYAGLFFVQYLYFISNRRRRRRIIDSFSALSEKNKLFWFFMGIFFIIVPAILCPILL